MGSSNIELQKAIVDIYNHLYANSEKKTPHGISKEVGKILHAGIFIEESTKTFPAFSFDASRQKEIMNGGGEAFAASVRDQFNKMNATWTIYPEQEGIAMNDFDLAYTCVKLNNIYLSDPVRDVFGDSLEIFRSQWAKQVGGQFFTDPLVTHLSMKLLQYDPTKGDDLVDICSGTGGFLLAGLNHIREILEEKGKQKNIEKKVVDLAKKSIIGKEYDKEVCAIANSTLRARLGNEDDLVVQGDSLEVEAFGKDSAIQFDKHLCVAGNPPFGTKITVKDPKILSHFELAKVKARGGASVNDKVVPRAPDILFLEQNIKLLKPGKGRMSLVVPYQILSGPQSHYIRKWLLLNARILSVIDLPADTFQPHTGTKGCLLTVQRYVKPLKSLEAIPPNDIFMSTPKWIGHDRRGNPVFRRNPDGTSTNEILTDFEALEKAYLAFLKGENFSTIHEESFVATVEDVLTAGLNQLNAQFHKPASFNGPKDIDKNWIKVKLDEVAKRIFYPGRFSRGYVERYDGAVPFYGGKEIIQMVTESNKWIRHDHPKIKELAVKKGWLLITRSGTTGIVSRVPEIWDGYAMSEHVIRIEVDEEKINPFYLLSFLKSAYCQELISKGVYGSVIDSITPDAIANIEVLVPKDKNLFNKICSNSEKSEAARNEALKTSSLSVRLLNEVLR